MRKKRGKKIFKAAFASLAVLLLLASCGKSAETKEKYMQISGEKAKNMMDTQTGYVILDVRTEEEFASGHIPGAVLIPDYEIEKRAEEALPDKEQAVLVYCRSGNRSKRAAETLAALGYTNVKEFGGILDWKYEIVK